MSGTGIQDTWPMPRYSTAKTECAHAIGVAIINFNNFEFLFFRLFSLHLETRNVPLEIAWNMYSQLQENRRGFALEYIYSKCESDPEVIAHVAHAKKYLDICRGNRNHLCHSDIDHSPQADISLRAGVKGDWENLNRLDLSVARLRQVADEMFSGWEYGWEIWAYLARRSGLPILPPFLMGTLPAALPQKPALPDSLTPTQNPRTAKG